MADERRAGRTPLRGRPLDENGAIQFETPAESAPREELKRQLIGVEAVIDRLEKFRKNEVQMGRFTGYQDDTVFLVVRDLRHLNAALSRTETPATPKMASRVREVWERCLEWMPKDDPKRLIDWIQDVLEPFVGPAVTPSPAEPGATLLKQVHALLNKESIARLNDGQHDTCAKGWVWWMGERRRVLALVEAALRSEVPHDR